MSTDNPCLHCGACCASFRVDFAREELQSEGGSVPDGLCVDLTDSLCRMRGTDHARPRCAALVGQVGERASCGIYEWRPSPCREFGLRAPLGLGDEACKQARARHGLQPTLTAGQEVLGQQSHHPSAKGSTNGLASPKAQRLRARH